jgi:UDP-N-acetylmuramoyl-tripeptide--D-alanyl-D-alanine ligase
MLELGRYSVSEHERLGSLARESADLVVAVGIRARVFSAAAGKAEVICFDTAQAAADTLIGEIKSGDVVLIKGSQSIRTERIVKALLADPADSKLLVRQDRRWLTR